MSCQFSHQNKNVKRDSCGSKPHALKLLLCGHFPPANGDSPGNDFGGASHLQHTVSWFKTSGSHHLDMQNLTWGYRGIPWIYIYITLLFISASFLKFNKKTPIHPTPKTCDCPSSRSRISRLSSVLVSRKSSQDVVEAEQLKVQLFVQVVTIIPCFFRFG